MNTDDNPEWPDIIGSGDYKRNDDKLREIAEKAAVEACDSYPDVLESILRAMQEARRIGWSDEENETTHQLRITIAELRQQLEEKINAIAFKVESSA